MNKNPNMIERNRSTEKQLLKSEMDVLIYTPMNRKWPQQYSKKKQGHGNVYSMMISMRMHTMDGSVTMKVILLGDMYQSSLSSGVTNH